MNETVYVFDIDDTLVGYSTSLFEYLRRKYIGQYCVVDERGPSEYDLTKWLCKINSETGVQFIDRDELHLRIDEFARSPYFSEISTQPHIQHHLLPLFLEHFFSTGKKKEGLHKIFFLSSYLPLNATPDETKEMVKARQEMITRYFGFDKTNSELISLKRGESKRKYLAQIAYDYQWTFTDLYFYDDCESHLDEARKLGYTPYTIDYYKTERKSKYLKQCCSTSS